MRSCIINDFSYIMKSVVVEMNVVNRCNVGSNPCGGQGKCVAGALFTYTCDCEDGYETKMGMCVKDKDVYVVYKVALYAVLVIIFIAIVILLLMKSRCCPSGGANKNKVGARPSQTPTFALRQRELVTHTRTDKSTNRASQPNGGIQTHTMVTVQC